MPQFAEFKKKHGPASECRAVPAKTLSAYRKKLPEPLIADWEESGWCAYGKGLIWLVDPDDFKPAVREWLGSATKGTVFARSAFGHLLVWNSEGAHLLDPHYGTIAKLIDDVGLVFNYSLCSARYLNNVLEQKLFDKALKKLGPLAHDECYGFEPALALGGDGTLKTLRKVKLLEQLSLLAQLTDELKRV